MSRSEKDWAEDRQRALDARHHMRQAEALLDNIQTGWSDMDAIRDSVISKLEDPQHMLDRLIGRLTIDWR